MLTFLWEWQSQLLYLCRKEQLNANTLVWVNRADQPCTGASVPELTSPVSQKVLLGLANNYKKIAELLLIPRVTNTPTKASRQILHMITIMLLNLDKIFVLDYLSSHFTHNVNGMQFIFLILIDSITVRQMWSITHSPLCFKFFTRRTIVSNDFHVIRPDICELDIEENNFWDLLVQHLDVWRPALCRCWKSLFLLQKHMPLPTPYLGKAYWAENG